MHYVLRFCHTQARIVLVTAPYDYLIYLMTSHVRSESTATVSFWFFFLLASINLRTKDDRLHNLLRTLEPSLHQFSVYAQAVHFP